VDGGASHMTGEAGMHERLLELFEIGCHSLELVRREEREADGYFVEELTFRTGNGESVRGVLTRPLESDGQQPAILCLHAHGFRYDVGASELLDGRPSLHSAVGPLFARLGYVALMIDMPSFGVRAEPGESARTKAAMWRGGSLAGQMVAEQSAAVGYLASRDDVDASRIGAFGISMGSTLGYWLAAVDRRVACVTHLCCLADFAALIEEGAHDLHGIYLTVPGLLNVAGNGAIAGLIAPRPQLACIGDLDPLTPKRAADIALDELAAAYRAAGAHEKLVIHRQADEGHHESVEMREKMLAFFDRYLMPGR